MHATTAVALAALLLSPTAAALGPWPAPPGPAVLPLYLQVPAEPAELTIGVPIAIPLVVGSSGVLGWNYQPLVERKVWLSATLDSGDPASFSPNPVVLPPGKREANATLAFTPTRLGALGLHLEARWATLPGNASLNLTRAVVKDALAVDGLAAGAPDADLDLALAGTLRSAHLAAEPLSWRVEGAHAPMNGTGNLTWVAAEGTGLAAPGGEPWSAEVRARYGPGNYTFRLVAGGARLAEAAAEVAVHVPEVRLDQGSVNFTLEVAEHPTTLLLASDSVNADGKPKAPGSALITRVVVADQNGLGDVRRVTFTYARNESGTLVPVWARSIEGLPAGLQATVEDRFDLSPMKHGAYVCTVTADGTGAPQAQRTFVITDSATDAVLRLDAAEVLPARATTLPGTLRVRDANFGTGPLDGSDVTALGVLHLKLFKGSAAVGEPGWALAAGGQSGPAPLPLDLTGQGTRSTAFAYRVEEGKGVLELPVQVAIPEGATAGTYRVSVAAESTLASAPFNVTALPRITKLSVGAAAPGEPLPVSVEAAPVAALAKLRLTLPWGAAVEADPGEVEASATLWRWNTTVPVPLPWDDEAPGNLTALADLGDGRVVLSPLGVPVNARSAAAAVANAPPRLEASLRMGGVDVGREAWLHPHAALELQAVARAADDNAVAADLRDELGAIAAEVRDWRGQLARFEADGDGAPAGTTFQVQPLGVEPGRYVLRLQARDDDGAVAVQDLAVNIGTHFRLGVAAEPLAFAPDANGTLAAKLPLRNLGNAAAGRLTVVAEGLPPGAPANVTLELANGTRLRQPLQEGFARLEAPRLVEPSEWAALHFEVDARQGIRAGVFAGRILVAGEAA